jgi:hypothetical protein
LISDQLKGVDTRANGHRAVCRGSVKCQVLEEEHEQELSPPTFVQVTVEKDAIIGKIC